MPGFSTSLWCVWASAAQWWRTRIKWRPKMTGLGVWRAAGPSCALTRSFFSTQHGLHTSADAYIMGKDFFFYLLTNHTYIHEKLLDFGFLFTPIFLVSIDSPPVYNTTRRLLSEGFLLHDYRKAANGHLHMQLTHRLLHSDSEPLHIPNSAPG